MKPKTTSEQPQQTARRMFPLNVLCCACRQEVQIDGESLSGAVPRDEGGDRKGVAIPVGLCP